MSVLPEFAAALVDNNMPLPPGLTTWNGSDPGRRFDVYRNTVMSSLIGVLSDTFPVTEALVGTPFFRAMAAVFITAAPPTSAVMADYGKGMPCFIRNFQPAASVTYLGDMAEFESLRLAVLNERDGQPMDLQALQPVLNDPTTLHQLRLEFLPATRLFRSVHPIVSLWQAHQGGAPEQALLAAIDLTQGENALIVRPALAVSAIPMTSPGAAFCNQLMQGKTLGTAIEREPIDTQTLNQTLAALLHSGAVAGFAL